jgi:FkbM family methyltransferase
MTKGIRKQILGILVSGLAFILRERLLAVGKIVLPRLPYGKAVAVASLLLEKFPTNKETKRYYDSARPRWMRDFSFRINPYCPVSKLFALTGLLQPEMTKELLATHDQGLLVDIGANFGYFSVLWMSKNRTEVLAIEPLRQNYELLTINLHRFEHRAKSMMCCLGERRGYVKMTYDPQYPMLSKVIVDLEDGQDVEMRTLADVLKENTISKIAVLKCDAEGYDVRILSSSGQVFTTRLVHRVFFESETWDGRTDPGLEDFRQLLLASGYRQLSGKGDMCYFLTES